MSSVDRNSALETYRPEVISEASAPAASNPLHIVQDRLQNRWKWMILLGVLLAPIFAFGGYLLAPVTWASVGYVQAVSVLKPLVTETMETERLDDFAAFIATRATLLRSDRVLESAVRTIRSGRPVAGASTVAGRDPGADILVMQRAFRETPDDAEAVAFLREGLTAIVPRGSSFIEVRYASKDPEVPAAAVNLVLDSFMDIYGPNAESEHEEQKSKIRTLASQERLRLEKLEEDRMAMARDAGLLSPDLTAAVEARQEKLRVVEERIDALTVEMRKLERQHRARMSAQVGAQASTQTNIGSDATTPSETPDSTTLEPTSMELEQFEPRLADIRRQLEDQRVLLELANRTYKAEHPALQRISAELAGKEGLYNAARDNALRNWRDGFGGNRSYGALKSEVSEHNLERTAHLEALARLNEMGVRLLKIDRDIASSQTELSRLGERLRELDREAESIRKGRIQIVEGASRRGSPESDKRLPLAFVGGVGGFVFSFAAFFILGSLDPRAYRVSQFQKDAKAGRWLGVVPDMTNLATDPGARELATNCVHRIRNKIESRREDTGTGYAMMVTSAFQGDGKTTVAVALALSYAESGHRTILVDCDFIGRALSHQFHHLHSPGICDVLRRGSIDGEIVEIGEKLSLLPVGMDRTFSASNLQIASLRRLLRTLRDRFDVVIVDSGPVTASVEAIPVASSCDGAVLAIRRGRSRSRLPESVRELTEAGVDYLGLVLNYADADDCRRYGSISKMSAEVAGALTGQGASVTRHPLLGDGAR